MISSIKDFKAKRDQRQSEKKSENRQKVRDEINAINRKQIDYAKSIGLVVSSPCRQEIMSKIEHITKAVKCLTQAVESLGDQDNGRMT